VSRTKSRLQLAAIVIASIVVLFGVVGYFAIPTAARWGIENVASRELGRHVHVDSISANPYTLRITINGLTVDGLPGEAAPLLTVQQATVNASISSVLRLAPVIDAVSINGLAANIVRLEAQRFNFDDIIERLRAKPKTDDEPARFALYNIQLANGGIQFDDRVGSRKHAVTEIAIGIPFISNLPVDAEVKVLPAFSARIDGSPLELKGETRPFHQTLESSIDVNLSGLDIAKYLSFAPVRLNFNVDNGTLDTDLRIAFRRATAASAEQRAQPAQTSISGTFAVNGFQLSEKSADGRLLGFKTLRLAIEDFDPFARRIVIGDVQLSDPDVSVVRSEAGEVNWVRFAGQAIGGAPPTAKPTADKPAIAKPASSPFAFSLKHAAIDGGRVDVVDQSVQFRQEFLNLSAEAGNLSNATGARGTVRLATELKDNGSASFDGELALAPLAGRLKYGAKDVKLRIATRYLANLIDAQVDGSSDITGVLEIAQSDPGLRLALRELALVGTGISIRGPSASGAAFDVARVAVSGGEIDLTDRTVTMAKVSLDGPRTVVRRLADGTINWARLIKRKTRAETAPTPSAPAPYWISIAEVELERGDVQFEDQAIHPNVKLRASAITGNVRKIVADGSDPVEFNLRTRFGSGGTLATNGNARWDVPTANVRIDARNLDVAALRPYVAARLNGELASAEVSSKGTLIVSKQKNDAALRVSYTGNARLSNFHALDVASNDLLKWQALDIDKVAVKLEDGPPLVELGKVALNDFFARVIVSEQGRLNLLDVVKRDGSPADAKPKTTIVAVATAPVTAPAAAQPRPTIRIASIEVARGNVNFTDNFVKPNFTANMTGLGGTVTALATDSIEPATLALQGEIDDEAPLQIGGRLSPLTPTVFLDIEGSTKGVDLPRLTSYSVKYAGYPIIKGKLSMDVKYKIEDQKLAASNHLFLDQLTFGERVDSPTATKLPVLLAVSLLKNSRGEIDINLPISGTLNDPKFSVGGLIVQVIVNLLTKIVTAPFSLLAAAFGGGEELGYVEFAPGSATLAATQTSRLQTLAKALNDRPGLRFDIIGRVDPAVDSDGILQTKYDAKLKAAKVRQLVRAGGESVDTAKVSFTEQERPALITQVYAHEKIPDKPRNFIGMAKTLPATEMEALIRANLAVTPEDLRALANQRASAVRDFLEIEGKISRERLFLVEPKLTTEGIKDQGAKTRVDFSLK
jgi:uncharacterized protein involved in outer membrane biogenesis